MQDLLSKQFESLHRRINEITYLHRDDIYDSLEGLLEESLQIHKAVDSIRYETSDKMKEEKEREKRRNRKRSLDSEGEEMMEENGDNEDKEETHSRHQDEERVKNSVAYKGLQKKLQVLDIVFFTLIFTLIAYFCSDFVKVIFNLK